MKLCLTPQRRRTVKRETIQASEVPMHKPTLFLGLLVCLLLVYHVFISFGSMVQRNEDVKAAQTLDTTTISPLGTQRDHSPHLPKRLSKKEKLENLFKVKPRAPKCQLFDKRVCLTPSDKKTFSRVLGDAIAVRRNATVRYSPIRLIRIKGERRAGVKYLMQLLNTALQAKVMAKVHTSVAWTTDEPETPVVDVDSTLLIIIAKNPYTWLTSLYRVPTMITPSSSFGDFLTKPYSAYKPDTDEFFDTPPNGVYDSVVQMRKRKYSYHMQMSHKYPHVMLLRYEDILVNYWPVLEDIRLTYAMERRVASSRASVPGTTEFSEYYLDDIAQLNGYHQIHLNIVNHFLDWKFENQLGYEKRRYANSPQDAEMAPHGRERMVANFGKFLPSNMTSAIDKQKQEAVQLLEELESISVKGYCPSWEKDKKDDNEFECSPLDDPLDLSIIDRYGHCCNDPLLKLMLRIRLKGHRPTEETSLQRSGSLTFK